MINIPKLIVFQCVLLPIPYAPSKYLLSIQMREIQPLYPPIIE
jgi:hypothetical protein